MWTWREFLELPRVEVTSDIHCVTRWSRFDNHWEGVAVTEILGRAKVRPEAVAVMAHSEGGYTTNIALADLQADDVLLAFRHDGQDLEPTMAVPAAWSCRSSTSGRARSGSARSSSSTSNSPGFWEVNGYHLHADPWKEERYSDQETDAMQRMRAESARRRRGH